MINYNIMKIYPLLRPILQAFDPEWTHEMGLAVLQYLPRCLFPRPAIRPVSVLGKIFSHPVGLSAGFDVSGAYLSGLEKLGFSFIEVGTVTPRPQKGNPKPRMFRLPEVNALINRMGFNNPGVDVLVRHLEKTQYQGILGINIGKNKETSLAHASSDYLFCMEKVYTYADYIAINISSPNTEGLRELQTGRYFFDLIQGICRKKTELAIRFQKQVPILVKISPDETDEAIQRMAETMVLLGVDGIIATNTTISRAKVTGVPGADERGGLSGVPLAERSLACLKLLKKTIGDKLTIVSVGGIDNREAIQQRLASGANLVQVYTGLVYNGLFI